MVTICRNMGEYPSILVVVAALTAVVVVISAVLRQVHNS